MTIKNSMFIKCFEFNCGNVVMNDDDNVCLCCGSKNTKRIKINSLIFKNIYK